VLNGKDDVSSDTVLRVREVIDRLNYAPGLAAQSMRSRRTGVIGLVVPDFDHSWGVEVMKAASRAITGTRYDLFAMTSGVRNHDERARWEQLQVSRLNGTLTDGVIVVVPDACEFLTEHPLVAVDPFRETDAYPSVVGDNYVAATDVMRYLFGLGHSRIAFIGGHDYLESSYKRRQAYYAAYVEAGIKRDLSLDLEGDFSVRRGDAAMRELLALPHPPTAVFAVNDDTALGALAAVRSAGLRVPSDISVVGFDNVPEARFCSPPLTTVDQGIGRIVRTAVDMVIELIEGRPLAQTKVVIPAHLVVRDSCAPPLFRSGI
jgi:LacI family transcriptional regulator